MESRRIWVGHVARMEEMRSSNTILVRKPEGKTPLRRPRRRWEDNIKLHFREIEFGPMDWIHVAQYKDRWRAAVSSVMNVRVS
jgi:ribosome biogenesis protein Nip4